MAVIPNTEVRLLNNVPLINSYEHQRTFNSKAAQITYFGDKTAHVFNDFTYQRHDSTINIPLGRDKIYDCNYVMFRNNDYASKWFYGFITKLEYVNPNTTKVHFEIDVYQTWQFDIVFNPSFVVREHRKRWNSDGSPVINTVDEGVDYGSEYVTKSVDKFIPFNDVFFLVMVCQSRMDTNSKDIEPNVNGSIQPLTYYIHPFKLDGTVPKITVDGMEQTLAPLDKVLKALFTSTVAVNNVASLYVTEYIGVTSLAFNMQEFEPVEIQDPNSTFTTLRVKNYPSYKNMTKRIGNKYANFTTVTESKLLMHPYTVTILTDMKGNVQEIKNEHIETQNLDITVRGSIGVSNKVAYHVKDYLMNESISGGYEASLQHAIINNNPNDVPIITDLLSAYLQGNRNSLQNQQNQIKYGAIAGILGSAMGAIGSAMGRNPVGAVSGMGDMAGGAVNAYFQMQNLIAKQKDLDATPPQISKMGGNTAFDYGNNLNGLYVIKKEITPEYRKRLTDYFRMFGYKVNELKVPYLKTRQHFNYIQTLGANITGNIPQDDINKIKNMFNSGVTLWHGDWVGNYALENNEV